MGKITILILIILLFSCFNIFANEAEKLSAICPDVLVQIRGQVKSFSDHENFITVISEDEHCAAWQTILQDCIPTGMPDCMAYK